MDLLKVHAASKLDDGNLAEASGANARGPVFGAAYTHDVADLADPARGLITRFVVNGNYKLLVHAAPDSAPELYDLSIDPEELDPIADPEQISKLRHLIDLWWAP